MDVKNQFNNSTLNNPQFYFPTDKEIPKILTAPPLKNELIIGRQDELKKIDLQISGRTSVVLVNGIGGIGKSTIAEEYWEATKDQYTHMAWISAQEGDLRLSLLSNLTVPLKLEDEFAQISSNETKLCKLRIRLNELSRNPCLIVIDNANSLEELNNHKGWLDQLGWHILITSRSAPDSYKLLEVEELQMPQCKEMFLRYYQEERRAIDFEEDSALDALLNKADRHTLMVEILAKVGRVRKIEILELLRDWENLELKTLSLQFKVTTNHRRFAGMEGEERLLQHMLALLRPLDLEEPFQNILRCFSLFPTYGVGMPTLGHLFSVSNENQIQFEEDLIRLVKDGWLQGRNGNFKMHPLIQKLVIEHLQPNSDSCEQLLECLQKRLELHLNEAHQWVDIASIISSKCSGDSKTLALLHGRISERTSEIGREDLCIQHLKKAIDQFDKVGDLENYGRALSRLGDKYQEFGIYTEALVLFEKRLKLAESLTLQYSTEIGYKNGLAISYCKLGDLYHKMGNSSEELRYYEKYRSIVFDLEKENPEANEFKENLAIAYSKLGDYNSQTGELKKAQDFYEKSLTLIQFLFNKETSEEKILNSLAACFSKLGDLNYDLEYYKKAEEFYIESYELAKLLLEQSPHNESFKNNFAIICEKLGDLFLTTNDYEKALTFLMNDLKLAGELAESNPRNEVLKGGFATANSKVAEAHKGLGSFKPALEYHLKSKEIGEEILKNNTLNTHNKNGLAVTYVNIGRLYKAGNLLKETQQYFEMARDIWTGLSLDAPQIIKYKQNLEKVLKDLEELQ